MWLPLPRAVPFFVPQPRLALTTVLQTLMGVSSKVSSLFSDLTIAYIYTDRATDVTFVATEILDPSTGISGLCGGRCGW